MNFLDEIAIHLTVFAGVAWDDAEALVERRREGLLARREEDALELALELADEPTTQDAP